MPTIKITRNTVERLQPATGTVPVYYFDQALKGFAVRVRRTGVKTFLVQGRVNGSLHRKTLGRWPMLAPEDARAMAQSILSAMLGGTAPKEHRKIVTAGALMEQWLKVHVVRKLKARTVADYTWIVRQVLAPSFGGKAVAEIGRVDVAKMHHERGATPRRANYYLAVAKSFFTFAEEQGHRPPESNPARRIRAYPERRRERFLSAAETAKAAAAINTAEAAGAISLFAAAGLRLCMLTGARQGEIATLTWREVDLERRLLLLEDSKTGRRTIYLNEAAAALLERLPRMVGNEYVVCGNKPGEPYKNLSRAWIRIRGSAGLNDVRLHDLRHTFASVAAAESVSLPIIGNLLGHSVPATTARYAHLAADPVRAANERVGARIMAMMAGASATAEPTARQASTGNKQPANAAPETAG